MSLQDLGANIAGSAPSETVIYTAGEFRTMDPARPTAAAVAVQDGRFVAVGNLADLQRTHVHPALAATTLSTEVIAIEDWDYVDGFSPAVRDAKEYRERLAATIKDFNESGASMDTPLITWGYHHYFHGPMDRAEQGHQDLGHDAGGTSAARGRGADRANHSILGATGSAPCGGNPFACLAGRPCA